jgi:hypothetical protein
MNERENTLHVGSEDVVAPSQDERNNEAMILIRDRHMALQERRRSPRANPDDPAVRRPPQGPNGPWPGPNYMGMPGRTAIVQAQVFLVGTILIAQLWLITTALYDLLSGQPGSLLWLALVSLLGFVLALIISLWPRRRIEGL